MTPLVSFIVISHARSRMLVSAITSIRQQSVVNREIVVVVNGHDCETLVNLPPLSDPDPTLRYIVLSENCGVGGGRNVGIQAAQGEILVFIDDDAEFAAPDITFRAMQHFDRHPGLGVVGFSVLEGRSGEIERRCIPFCNKRLPVGVTAACYFAGGACAIRRKVFDAVGPYDASLFYGGEELDLSYRAIEAGFQILFDPALTIRHHAAGGVGLDGLYYCARNRPWVALRYLPLPMFLTHCLAWWGWSLIQGCRKRAIPTVLRGIRDSVVHLPAIWVQRRPLSPLTLEYLEHNSGRRWY